MLSSLRTGFSPQLNICSEQIVDPICMHSPHRQIPICAHAPRHTLLTNAVKPRGSPVLKGGISESLSGYLAWV